MKKYLLITLSIVVVLWANLVAAAEDIAPRHIMGATTINTDTARLLLARGYVFIDVRKPEDYHSAHIPGAQHLSVNSRDFTASNLQAIVSKQEALVFYCNGAHCLGSSKASQKAVEWGWRYIFYYRDGIQGWKEAGFAVE